MIAGARAFIFVFACVKSVHFCVSLFWCVYLLVCVDCIHLRDAPPWAAADAEIKIPSDENRA